MAVVGAMRMRMRVVGSEAQGEMLWSSKDAGPTPADPDADALGEETVRAVLDHQS